MTKLKKLRIFLLMVPLTLFWACAPKVKDSRPNIILILADDLGWSDLGCYGGEVETPNLDLLAKNGIRYTQFYNTSKCFPSRASLLTGLYAQQVGADKTWAKPWANNSTTIGKVLRSAGYTTLWSGKHHGTDKPTDLGFDDYYGLFSGACNHFNPGNQRKGEPVPAQKRQRKWIIDGQLFNPYTPESDSFYTTDNFTNAALEWISEFGNSEKPYFLYLSYTAPHDPLMAWPSDIEKYRGKYKDGYANIRERRFEKMKALGLVNQNMELPQASHDPWAMLREEEKDEEDLKMAVYAAMIDRMDQNIGRIINQLKKQGTFDNTLILFMSDNGSSSEVVRIPGNGKIGTMGQWASLGRNWANVSNTPLRYYKNFSYEGGINTPLIVHWPAQIQGGIVNQDQVAHFIDILPSLANIAEARYPDDVIPFEGTALIFGEGSTVEKPIGWKWQDGKAFRDGDWKIVLEGEMSWELYNLDSDRGETKNLASEHPEKVAQLARQFDAWEKRVSQP